MYIKTFRMKIDTNYIEWLSSYRAVNTLQVCYNNQLVKAKKGINVVC